MRLPFTDAVRLAVAGVTLLALALGLALAVANLERSADESRTIASAERLRAEFIQLSARQEADLRYLLGVARGAGGASATIEAQVRRLATGGDPRGISVWSTAGSPQRVALGGRLAPSDAARTLAGRTRARAGVALAGGGAGVVLYALKERSAAGTFAAVIAVPVADASRDSLIGGPLGAGQIWIGTPGDGALIYTSESGDLPSARAERSLDLGDTALTVVVRDDSGAPIVGILLGVAGLVLTFGFAGAALAMRRGARRAAALQSENADLSGQIRASEDRREQTERRAERDPLTGLPNRNVMKRHLRQAVSRAKRTKEVSVLFFIDLDGFKAVNDTLGHQAGDELLVSVGRRLDRAFRGNDTVARFAGDEFCVFCEDIADNGAAACLKIERLLAEPVYYDGMALPIRASIGMALAGELTDDPDALLREADAAMYRAKQQGGGRVVVAAPTAEHTAADDAV